MLSQNRSRCSRVHGFPGMAAEGGMACEWPGMDDILVAVLPRFFFFFFFSLLLPLAARMPASMAAIGLLGGGPGARSR